MSPVSLDKLSILFCPRILKKADENTSVVFTLLSRRCLIKSWKNILSEKIGWYLVFCNEYKVLNMLDKELYETEIYKCLKKR